MNRSLVNVIETSALGLINVTFFGSKHILSLKPLGRDVKNKCTLLLQGLGLAKLLWSFGLRELRFYQCMIMNW